MTTETGTELFEGESTYTAFAGEKMVASGALAEVLPKVKRHLDGGGGAALFFEDRTGRQVDFDLSGTAEEALARAEPQKGKPGPGRPKLGVVSREVSLLPRHWEWLEAQPNGASAAIRRLIDEARKREPGKERARMAREAAGKFMWTMGGDLPGFEEASRALYARDDAAVERLVKGWPKDVKKHLRRLVEVASELEKAADEAREAAGKERGR